MKRLVFALLILPSLAGAQVYKCVINGKTQYAERPCAPAAQALNIRDDITPERQAEAEAVAQREKAMALGIEADQLYERADQIRAESAAKAAAKRSAGRCDQLLQTARDAENESKKWRYHQGLIDDAKRRQKEAEDAHFSECYGSVR